MTTKGYQAEPNSVTDAMDALVSNAMDKLQELDHHPFLNEVPDIRDSVINEISDDQAPLIVQELIEEVHALLEELHDDYQEHSEYWAGLLLENDLIKEIIDAEEDGEVLQIVTLAGIFNIPRNIDDYVDEDVIDYEGDEESDD